MEELKPVEVSSDPNIPKIYSIIQLNNAKISSKVEANQGKILPGFTEILQYGLLTFIRNTIDELIKVSFLEQDTHDYKLFSNKFNLIEVKFVFFIIDSKTHFYIMGTL